MVFILAFLAWMIVPFFMKKRRYEERQEAERRRGRAHGREEEVEELDEGSIEVLDDDR